MKPRKESRDQWLTSEEQLLLAHYSSRITMPQLCAMLPRHTRQSIRVHATSMGLKRPRGIRDEPRPTPAWDLIKSLIGREMLSREALAQRLGVTKQAVALCLDSNRTRWYVAGWIDPIGKGRPTALISLGCHPDAIYQRRVRTREEVAARAVNPFMIAAGTVKPRETITGRVIRQDMTIHSDELEAA